MYKEFRANEITKAPLSNRISAVVMWNCIASLIKTTRFLRAFLNARHPLGLRSVNARLK